MTAESLRVESLSVAFRTDDDWTRVVDDVSFEVGKGEIVALVGESGSGKSVTAQAIMGLLNRVGGRLDSGRVMLGDVDLAALPERRLQDVRGRDIAMIFQEPSRALNPSIRVGEQIAETIRRHRPTTSRAEARRRAIELLGLVEIPDPQTRVDWYPHQLSGGQAQRVMIAIALSCDPAFLIADEPTTALDVTVQAQVLALLKSLRERLGLGILLITHDLGVVAEMCDRAVVMYAGQVVETGVTREVFAEPEHPYTSGLLGAVPTTGAGRRRFRAIPGTVPAPAEWPVGCRFQARCAFAIAGKCTDAPIPMIPVGPSRESRCVRVDELDLPGALADPAPESLLEEIPLGDPILVARGLSKSYRRFGRRPEHLAVDDVDLTVRSGETVAIVGESGAGKSTLGRLLNRLDEADTGTIEFDGIDVRALRGGALRRLRRDVQMIFQDPFNSLNPRQTVGASVREAMDAHDIGDRADRDAMVDDLFRRVGLRPEHRERYPHEFSGGQLQRIAIARALAVQPRVIVCDEPVAALDASIRAQILNLLLDLQRERGIAYVFVTHDLALVPALAHQVVVMQNGKIVESGPAEVVVENPESEYAQRLVAAIPRIDAAL